MKFLSLILICGLLCSCTSGVHGKPHLRKFDNLSEPIVITMPCQDSSGSIFVVIDTDSGGVFDWCYCNSELDNWRTLEVIDLENRYAAVSVKGNELFCITPLSGKVEKSILPFSSLSIDYYRNYGSSILLSGFDYKKGALKYCLYTFDLGDGSIKNTVSITTDSLGYMGHPIVDEKENCWIISSNKDMEELIMIDKEKEMFPEYKYEFPTRVENFIVKHTIMLNYSENIYIRSIPVVGNINNNTIYIFDKEKGEVIERIDFKFEQNQYLSRMFHYENDVYGVLIKNGLNNPLVSIIKFYDDLRQFEFISKDFNYDFTENIWVKNGKLWLMNSRDKRNITYISFDLIKCCFSEIYQLDFGNIINGCF